MSYCTYCGKILKEEGYYCGQCGARKEPIIIEEQQPEWMKVVENIKRIMIQNRNIVIGVVAVAFVVIVLALVLGGSKKSKMCDTWYTYEDGEYEEYFTLYKDGMCEGDGIFESAHWTLTDGNKFTVIGVWGDHYIYFVKSVGNGVLVLTDKSGKYDHTFYSESKVR